MKFRVVFPIVLGFGLAMVASSSHAFDLFGSYGSGAAQKVGAVQKGCEQKGCVQKGCEQKGCVQKGCRGVAQKGCEQKGCEQKGCEQKGSTEVRSDPEARPSLPAGRRSEGLRTCLWQRGFPEIGSMPEGRPVPERTVPEVDAAAI